MYDIIIIGAGVSGLTSAISAKTHKPDLNILVLEKQNKCGRKLSASGNGKCNVTNVLFEAECYHSSDRDFVSAYASSHSPDEVKDFFDYCGIPLYNNNGYYYPLSNQAKQVTCKLIELCERLGIEILTDKEVVNISSADGRYIVYTDSDEYIGNNVIIASGSNASDKLGGSESGYTLVNKLGLSVTTLYPGLSPIFVKDDKLSVAKGVRLNGTATLHIDGFVKKESGQIQINEDNLSGIVMMNLSCYLPAFNNELYKDSLWLDVMPLFSWDELKDYIELQCQKQKDETVRSMLEGFLPAAFVRYFLLRLSIKDDIRLCHLTEKQINKITSNIKKLTFTPVLQSDYSKAQVTLGGVSISEINPQTFECIRYPGMYVVGELLDMTGKCGGYNITFAILSGISAANNILFS